MKDDRVTGYVCWRARDQMQDDRSTPGVCRLEGEGADAGRQECVTGYVGWKARELMQDNRGTSQGMSVGRRGI